MLKLLWLALAAEGSPCDAAPKAPKIPLASEFQCPGGAAATAGPTSVECLARDGKPTGDTFAVEGKTGLMVHPLGLTVAWADGAVQWWQQRPTGHRVAYEGQRPARVEHYVGGELSCARHYEGARLVKRFDEGRWVWLDRQGRAIPPAVPLDKAELASVMREHAAEIQLCYESRLREVKGEFRGTVALKVEIARGAVKGVTLVEDTLHDPPVTDCLSARIAAWQFRAADEELEVTFPFVFKEHR